MALVKDTVVVLKSVNFSEADKILTVFGRNYGKYTLLAKGIRKLESKNRGNMQTLSMSNVSFYQGQNMGVLTESELIGFIEFTHKNADFIQKVLYLVNKLVPDDEREPAIFEKLAGLFKRGFTPRNVNNFRINFLRGLGYVGDLNCCSVCGKIEDLKLFDLDNLVFICKKCGGEVGGSAREASIIPVSDLKYESPVMTKAIDTYVTRIVEGT